MAGWRRGGDVCYDGRRVVEGVVGNDGEEEIKG